MPRNEPSISDIVTQMVHNLLSSSPGLKVLLCDEEMLNVLSIAYTQRELLHHQIVFVDLLSKFDRSRMRYMKCVILARPTAESYEDISQELQRANYSSYRIFFTGTISTDALTSVCNADQRDLIEHVEEVFMDVTPLTGNTSVIPLRPSQFTAGRNTLVNPLSLAQWDNAGINRTADGIISVMLLLKKRPIIRYRGGSRLSERIAQAVSTRMKFLDTTFPELRVSDAVVLICDRLDDPCTPLLSQWSYEAMIHELIGYKDGNKVILEAKEESIDALLGSDSTKKNDDADDRIHVLSPQHDTFFEKYRYEDWGTLIQGVQSLVKEYKDENSLDRTQASLDDIKNFLAKFPEAKKRSLLTTRHTAIISRLADEVRSRNLYKISEVEQQLFEYDAVTLHSNTVLELVQSTDTELEDALRLTILYTLRYELDRSNNTPKLKMELSRRGCTEQQLAMIDTFVRVAGSQYRHHALFQTKSQSLFKGLVQNIPGMGSSEVRNVYTLHQPLIKRLITRLYNGQLREDQYPVLHSSELNTQQAMTMKAREIVLFMPGGVSYEEVRLVEMINRGTVANVVETSVADVSKKLGVGAMVSAAVSDSSSAVQSSRTTTASKNIEATVVLTSPAVINSSQFLSSMGGSTW